MQAPLCRVKQRRRFHPATGKVVTVEISVLANSVTDGLRDVQTVCLGCSVFTGTADRKIRAEFQSVIGIRN